jgi:hypothetical protein
MMATTTPCAFCGTTTAARIQGRSGCACVNCIGEAAKQAIAKTSVPERTTLTASDRCLLCGDVVTKHDLAAAHSPYVLCHGCLINALQVAHKTDGGGSFIQVNF